MLFLIMSNIKITFINQKLQQRSYTTNKALLTIRPVEPIGKKKFLTTALNLDLETFIVHVAFLVSYKLGLDIHLFCKAQIASLKAVEISISVPSEYVDCADIFFQDLVTKLAKHIRINNYTINLVKAQQSYYGPIYSLGPMESKTLKTYIETNLTNRFIQLSKSSVDVSILFVKKLKGCFYLCIDYQSFHTLTIKSSYSLPLIGECLIRLVWTKHFIQLDLTSVYH